VRAVLTPFALVFVLALAGEAAGRDAAAPHDRFAPASPTLRAMCVATARTVGYPVPCPTRVPVGLVAFGGRPGCELQIIGPAKPCPNSVFVWKDWVVGSSTTADEHLVLTASPRIVRSAAKIVNGPVWQPGQTICSIGYRQVGNWRMHVVFVPPDTNDGSAFASHVVLVWTVGQHTYAVGFHDVSTINQTLALDLTLARGIRLVSA
jgi:hypothetical protein